MLVVTRFILATPRHDNNCFRWEQRDFPWVTAGKACKTPIFRGIWGCVMWKGKLEITTSWLTNSSIGKKVQRNVVEQPTHLDKTFSEWGCHTVDENNESSSCSCRKQSKTENRILTEYCYWRIKCEESISGGIFWVMSTWTLECRQHNVCVDIERQRGCGTVYSRQCAR